MNLNVSINKVCVVTDIAGRHDTLLFYIEYFITQEITIRSFTGIKIKYCIRTAFHGDAVNVNKLIEPFKDEAESVRYKHPVRTAQ